MTIRFGILTLSDRSSRGERADASGPALARLIEAEGWFIAKQALLPDDESAIRNILIEWADSGEMEVILTTGGTGFAPRDVTPEATRAVIDREAPGLAEAMRAASLPNASFRTRRHTAASWTVQSGAPLFEARRILGHTSPAMTRHHAHQQPDQLRLGGDALAAVQSDGRGMETYGHSGVATERPADGNAL